MRVRSPKTPTPTSPAVFTPRIVPFRLRRPGTRVKRSTVVSNGQLIAAAHSSVPPASSTSLVPAPDPALVDTFTTPEEAADVNSLEYDRVLGESDELANLHQHHQAISALSNVTNKDQDSSSPSSQQKVPVPPLSLDQLADRAMHTRQASAQLEQLAIENKENQDHQAKKRKLHR